MLRKSILLGAFGLIAMAFAVNASAQYPVYPSPYAYPASPPSWGYDPYTSGLSACVQWRPSDPESCRSQRMPSYGQPPYWYGR
jgi:hypothetical protein